MALWWGGISRYRHGKPTTLNTTVWIIQLWPPEYFHVVYGVSCEQPPTLGSVTRLDGGTADLYWQIARCLTSWDRGDMALLFRKVCPGGAIHIGQGVLWIRPTIRGNGDRNLRWTSWNVTDLIAALSGIVLGFSLNLWAQHVNIKELDFYYVCSLAQVAQYLTVNFQLLTLLVHPGDLGCGGEVSITLHKRGSDIRVTLINNCILPNISPINLVTPSSASIGHTIVVCW